MSADGADQGRHSAFNPVTSPELLSTHGKQVFFVSFIRILIVRQMLIFALF